VTGAWLNATMADQGEPADLPGGEDGEFWSAGPQLEDVGVSDAQDLDDDEAPALRRIRRPPQWNAPAPPNSVLAAVYGSVRRRAREFLRSGSSDADEGEEP